MFCGWVTFKVSKCMHREDEPDLSHQSRRDHRLISRHASQYSLRTNEPWYPRKQVKPTTLSNHIPPYLAYRKLLSENVNEFRRLALLIDHILQGASSKVIVAMTNEKHEPSKYHTASRAHQPSSPPFLQSDTFSPSSTTPWSLRARSRGTWHDVR